MMYLSSWRATSGWTWPWGLLQGAGEQKEGPAARLDLLKYKDDREEWRLHMASNGLQSYTN